MLGLAYRRDCIPLWPANGLEFSGDALLNLQTLGRSNAAVLRLDPVISHSEWGHPSSFSMLISLMHLVS